MPTEPAGNLTADFLRATREMLLDQSWARLRTCVEALSDEQIWWRPNASSNSIGNLMLHLNGNVTQWILTSFGGAEDARNRPAEFSRTEGLSRDELVSILSATMDRVAATLRAITETELLSNYEIQGYRTTGLEAIYHVVEHFALHYGQVAYVTKMLCDKDLGFYRELNATGRMQPESNARP